MKIVIQRVKRAQVSIEQDVYSSIGNGLLLLVGVGPDDSHEDVDYAVRKILNMRIFSDQEGKMNVSIKDIEGEILMRIPKKGIALLLLELQSQM